MSINYTQYCLIYDKLHKIIKLIDNFLMKVIPQTNPIGTDYTTLYSLPDYIKIISLNNEVEKDGVFLGADFYSNNYGKIEIRVILI